MDNQQQNERNNRDETTWKESPYLIIKGFLMGSADIVPGVSGGTMALITGIYQRLINAIKSVDSTVIENALKFRVKKVLELFHWKFFVLLFTGLGGAVLFFTKIVPLQIYMFTHTEIVYGLFFGLILGSIFLLIVEVSPEKRGWKNALPIIAGSIIGFWIVTLVPADTPETFWYVFISGAISICAMILPGISGSYILLILRKYDYILTELGNLASSNMMNAIVNLTPFFLGAILGLALFARILSWLLKHFHAATILVLVGFLIGSLYVIWPFQEREYYESVRAVEVLPYSDPIVQELLLREEEPELPRYQRIRTITEDSSEPGARVAEVETVSIQLLNSEPFIPDFDSDEVNVGGGFTGGIIGLLMIWFISYLRQT